MTNDIKLVTMSASAGSAGQGQYQDPNNAYPHPSSLRRPQGLDYGVNDHDSYGEQPTIHTEESAATPRGIEDGTRAKAYLDHMMSLQSRITGKRMKNPENVKNLCTKIWKIC